MKRGHLRETLELLESNLRQDQQIANLNNTYHNYAAVSAHTLLLWGGKDDLHWVAPAIEKLSPMLPSAQVKRFPRLNHLGPEQAGPRQVAQVVRHYFASEHEEPQHRCGHGWKTHRRQRTLRTARKFTSSADAHGKRVLTLTAETSGSGTTLPESCNRPQRCPLWSGNR
jgi:hypothetical protein